MKRLIISLLSLIIANGLIAQDTLELDVDVYMRYDTSKHLNIYLLKKNNLPYTGMLKTAYSKNSIYYDNIEEGYKNGISIAKYKDKKRISIGFYLNGKFNGKIRGYELQKNGKWKLVDYLVYDNGQFLKSVSYKKTKIVIMEYNPDITDYKKAIISKTIIKKGAAWVEESEYLEDISIIENMTDGIKKSL